MTRERRITIPHSNSSGGDLFSGEDVSTGKDVAEET